MIKDTMDESVIAYFEEFPPAVKKQLLLITAAVQKILPEAQLVIKYAIPTFVQKGNIISFGAWKTHIGIYPVPRGVPAFEPALSAYPGGKGTLQLPLHEPLPLELISRIVRHNYESLLRRQQKKVKSM